MAKIIDFPERKLMRQLQEIYQQQLQQQQQTKDQQQIDCIEVQSNMNNCLRALELTTRHLSKLDDGSDEDCCLYLLYHYKGETGFINLGFNVYDLADKFQETMQLLGVKVEIEGVEIEDDGIDDGGALST